MSELANSAQSPHRHPKKILYLHPHFTLPGGAGRHALETGRVLASRGWDVHIASINNKESLISEYRESITFHTLGGPLSSSLFYWPHLPILITRVLRCIEEVKPEIVFSQVFPANWWGFIAKMKLGSDLSHIWMCQEPSAFIHSQRWINTLPFNITGIAARIGNPILKWLDVRLARKVDYVFANSNFSRRLAFDAYGYGTDKVGICYPGVDLSRFSPEPSTPKIQYKFITCARLTKFKNIDKILKAISMINDLRVTLTVIGQGEEYESLIELSESLDLSNRVTFLKTVSDLEMINELRTSYGLIHAAEEEPFGLTPVEAMACGTPVIAMRGGGPAETVVHESTGYLCDGASGEEIADAISWLISQEYRSYEISDACLKRAQEFTWESAVTDLEEVFTPLRE